MDNRPLTRYLAWLPTSFPDFIAGILVIAGLIMLSLGIDSEVKSLTAMGAAFLFGRALQKSNERKAQQ